MCEPGNALVQKCANGSVLVRECRRKGLRECVSTGCISIMVQE